MELLNSEESALMKQSKILQKSINWCEGEIRKVWREVESLDDNPKTPNRRKRLKKAMDKLIYLIPKLGFEGRQAEKMEHDLLEAARLKKLRDVI